MNDLVIGRRGLGKSTLAEYLARENNDNVLVFDPNNQFRDAVLRTNELAEVESELENADDDEPFFVSYIPQGEVEQEWDRFAALIWNYGDYSLIIDEAHRLQKPQYVNLWLDRFIRQAPRRERNDESPIDIVQTFHRPVDVNGIVLGLADYVYIFRTTKSRDLEYLTREFGVEVAERASTLRTPQSDEPGRDVLKVNVEEPEDFELLTDPTEWYIDIRKPAKEAVPYV